MPVLASLHARFARQRPLAGVRVAACLHVTVETAVLVRCLTAGGAEVALCAANPLSTQDDAAAALTDDDATSVLAVRGEAPERWAEHLAAVADTRPQITLDDGADVLGHLHERGGAALAGVLGGTEETPTGALRLRALEREGGLAVAVIAVHEARTARLLDGTHGTGQSTLDGILRATNLLLAGRRLVVLGFGAAGRGIALRARGAGAEVIVCEVDPVRALEARLEGYGLMPALDAAAVGDVLVCATGGRDALGAAHLARLRDGAILVNAGHFDVEIDVAALEAAALGSVELRPSVREYHLADGRRVRLLAAGRVVNLAAGEGHPPAVMDIAFAAQALAVEHLVRHAGGVGPGVHPLPPAIDREVAALGLAALGLSIDGLTPAQARYLAAWEPAAGPNARASGPDR